MKKRSITKVLTLISLGICGVLLLPGGLQAVEGPSPILPFRQQKGTFYTHIDTDYYYTNTNFSRFFSMRSLSKDLSLGSWDDTAFFQYTGWNLRGGYVPADWVEIEAFMRGFWFAQSGDGQQLRFTIPNIRRGGIIFRGRSEFVEKKPHQRRSRIGVGIVPEILLSFPFFHINYQTNKPVTDDGSVHFMPGLWLYVSAWEIIYPYIYTGLKYRSYKLSSMLKWQAGMMFKGDIAQMGLGTYGFWSVVKDSYSAVADKDRMRFLQNVNAGSLKFLSQNPGVMGFMGWFSWYLPPYFTLQLKGSMDVNGSQYAKGYNFLVSVITDFGTRQKSSADIFKSDSDFQSSDSYNEPEESGFRPASQSPEKEIEDNLTTEQRLNKAEEEQERAFDDDDDD